MKVKVLRSTVADGRPVSVGEVVELSGEDGTFLINVGKAERYEEPEAPARKPRAKKPPVNRMVDEDDLESR